MIFVLGRDIGSRILIPLDRNEWERTPPEHQQRDAGRLWRDATESLGHMAASRSEPFTGSTLRPGPFQAHDPARRATSPQGSTEVHETSGQHLGVNQEQLEGTDG